MNAWRCLLKIASQVNETAVRKKTNLVNLKNSPDTNLHIDSYESGESWKTSSNCCGPVHLEYVRVCVNSQSDKAVAASL